MKPWKALFVCALLAIAGCKEKPEQAGRANNPPATVHENRAPQQGEPQGDDLAGETGRVGSQTDKVVEHEPSGQSEPQGSDVPAKAKSETMKRLVTLSKAGAVRGSLDSFMATDGAAPGVGHGGGGAVGLQGMGSGSGGGLGIVNSSIGLAPGARRLRSNRTVSLEALRPHNTEEYDRIYEKGFLAALDNPLSTFSIDVDTASYANVRRFLNRSQMPLPDAVRIEELVNYFRYEYQAPEGDVPFSVNTEISACPWAPEHRLVLVGVQGREVETAALPPSNFVFLLDVSGSMRSPRKLPLLKKGLRLLVDQMRPEDSVAIVVYAGAAGLKLPATTGRDKARIVTALEELQAGGSTAGGAGIQLAYEVAKEHFRDGGNNRVILATDGDFNVGASSTGELVRLIEEKRKEGIFLTVLGFGTGNIKDSRMEQLADKGNGNYAYIDNILEAKKVLVTELGGTLHTIAKDVKIQVEFNPTRVAKYRLIGYENRLLAKEDFADDTKDAGELGAGHTVTALYEVVPAAGTGETAGESLKYSRTEVSRAAAESGELMTVKLRFKMPDSDTSGLVEVPVQDRGVALAEASENFRWAASVAAFGMVLRNSEYKGNATFQAVLEWATSARGEDPHGYRTEFLQLVEKANLL